MQKVKTITFLTVILLLIRCSNPSSPKKEKPVKVDIPPQVAAPKAAPKAAPENGQSVVLIVVDTMRVDRLGCYGYQGNISPAIDQLARDSVLFQSAYSTAPWTLPAMSSIMTGHYPRVVGNEGKKVKMDDRFVTLAELFKEKGYKTGAIVSHIFVGEKYGFAQGFDSFNEEESGKGDLYVSSPGVTKKAIEFLRENAKTPFFLFLHYFDPHYNYLMHPILNTYPDYRGRLKSGIPIKRLRQMGRNRRLRPHDKKYLQALYASEIRFTDFHIGKVLNEMKQLGLFEDSTVVFTGDHGEELAERRDNWIGHTKKVTDTIIHVPLMIKLPGKGVTRQVKRSVSMVDLMPTIASLLGLRVLKANEISGRVLDLKKPSLPRPIFSETGRWMSMLAVITGKWKLVANLKVGRSRLFNLNSDYNELRDVRHRRPEIVEKMTALWQRWEKKQDATKKQLNIDYQEPILTGDQKKKLRALGYVQ